MYKIFDYKLLNIIREIQTNNKSTVKFKTNPTVPQTTYFVYI